MMLMDGWVDRKNGDYISVDDINTVAHAVQDIERAGIPLIQDVATLKSRWVDGSQTYFDQIEWDGKIGANQTSFSLNSRGYPRWIKVSDQVLSKTQLESAVVEYHHNSVFDRNESYLYSNDTLLHLRKNWSLRSRPASAWSIYHGMSTIFGEVGAGTEGGWVIDTQIQNPWENSPRVPYLNRQDRPDSHGAWLGLAPRKSWNVCYTYTVEHTGTIDINIDSIVNYAVADANVRNPKYIAIFHNGSMIWPHNNGDYSNPSWYWILDDDINLSALKNADLLKGVAVEKNDTIELIGNASKNDEPFDAVYVGLTIDYKETNTTFSRNVEQSPTGGNNYYVADGSIASFEAKGDYMIEYDHRKFLVHVPAAGTYVFTDYIITSIAPLNNSREVYLNNKFLSDNLVIDKAMTIGNTRINETQLRMLLDLIEKKDT